MVLAARALLLPLACALSLAYASTASGAGGRYVFDGGTARQQAQVRSALAASGFDWNVVPAEVTIHLSRTAVSSSTPGHIWLDADLLGAGVFAWATVQDEYAHQVDFYLFDDDTRTRLNGLLGGKDWCRAVVGLRHSDYGCERFASTLVWSYWPSPANAYRPESSRDESAAMAPARFRALMTGLLRVRASGARAVPV